MVINHTSGRIVLTPQFGFVACFIPQAVFALFYVQKWDLNLSFQTMFVLISGCTWFLIVSVLVYKLPRIKIKTAKRSKSGETSDSQGIFVERWKFVALLTFQLIVLGMLMRYILNLPGGSFSEKLYYRDYASKRVEGGLSGADMSTLLSVTRSFSYYSGFLTSYLIIHGFVYKNKKNRLLMSLCYMMSILSSLLLGQRFGVYSLIVAALVQWYFIRGRAYGWKKILSAKTLVKILIMVFLGIFAFVQLGSFIGKGGNISSSDYIALYLSAQLKNLDIYIRNGNFGSGVENWQTLYGWVNFFADVFGISSWKHFYDQPFYYYNGYALGNVATVFYWFLHDGGYFGVFVFTSIMAVISQMLFRHASANSRNDTIDMSVVIYSYLFYGIVFSFYSNRFFAALNPDFFKFLLSLYVLKWYFLQIRVRVKSHKKMITGETRNA